jgi:hypothetical protein
MPSIGSARDHFSRSASAIARSLKYVAAISFLLIVAAFLFFFAQDQTFVHIDAIAHVNKARNLFDKIEPGLQQLGTIWLPLPHLLMAPLAAIDPLWRTGIAGSVISILSFSGTSILLFLTGLEWTGSLVVGWLAFFLFALNPHLIYLFTTPENEPLMIFCAAGLLCYLVRWSQDENWKDFALAAVFVFAGTWTRYEGWALAAMATVLIPIVTRKNKVAASIIFAGAAVAGPMLWMLFNHIYFEDPIAFIWSAGSAQSYAAQTTFITAGKWWDSASLYFMDAAYCLNPMQIWLAIAGIISSLMFISRKYWRPTVILIGGCITIFAFYTINLYLNIVPISLPGMLENDPHSVMNVRYGSVMAAAVPLFAAQFVFVIWRQVERRRAYSLLLLAPLFLPDPLPNATHEPMSRQFTENLFYVEAIHNQSFWMPPFVEIAKKLKSDIEARNGQPGLILTNTRIVHVVVWATGIPMRRFVTEMNKRLWESNLANIRPNVQWIITEEGDQLWHTHAALLQQNFIEVASAKGETTGRVHLYRRQD